MSVKYIIVRDNTNLLQSIADVTTEIAGNSPEKIKEIILQIVFIIQPKVTDIIKIVSKCTSDSILQKLYKIAIQFDKIKNDIYGSDYADYQDTNISNIRFNISNLSVLTILGIYPKYEYSINFDTVIFNDLLTLLYHLTKYKNDNMTIQIYGKIISDNPIPLSFNLATVLPRRSTSRVSYVTHRFYSTNN